MSFDGTRQSITSEVDLLVTIIDGNQNELDFRTPPRADFC